MGWNWPWAKHLAPGADGARVEHKSGGGFVALHAQGEPLWTRSDYGALAREGFMRNPVVHRAVRLIAEAAAAVPWLLYEDTTELSEHPMLALLGQPNGRQGGIAFLETLYGHLLMAGNAYVEVVEAGEAREMHLLRPDRVNVVTDAAGWPVGLEAARRHCREKALDDGQPGDILLFRWRAQHPAKHLGILCDGGRFIHAYEGHAVTISPLISQWRRRIAGVFAFPDIQR